MKKTITYVLAALNGIIRLASLDILVSFCVSDYSSNLSITIKILMGVSAGLIFAVIYYCLINFINYNKCIALFTLIDFLCFILLPIILAYLKFSRIGYHLFPPGEINAGSGLLGLLVIAGFMIFSLVGRSTAIIIIAAKNRKNSSVDF